MNQATTTRPPKTDRTLLLTFAVRGHRLPPDVLVCTPEEWDEAMGKRLKLGRAVKQYLSDGARDIVRSVVKSVCEDRGVRCEQIAVGGSIVMAMIHLPAACNQWALADTIRNVSANRVAAAGGWKKGESVLASRVRQQPLDGAKESAIARSAVRRLARSA